MTVTLQKDQSLSLLKDNGTYLSKVRLGLGWDAVKRGLFGRTRDIDLDASAILVAGGAVKDIVYFGQLKSRDGSVSHSGDNLTGVGDGDDEQIVIDLDRVATDVDKVVLVITSYSGQTFSEVENVFARVVDIGGHAEHEVVRYNLADAGAQTANIIAKLNRTSGAWTFTALGIPGTGKTAHKVTDLALHA